MLVNNGPLFTNADMSTASLTSPSIPLVNNFGYAIQLVFTGAPVGSVSIYVSCDPYPSNAAGATGPTHFTLLADSTTAISAAGDIMFNINNVNYTWFKVVYSKISGTGTLNGRYNLKGF